MENVNQLKCSKCGTTTKKVAGQAWPKCCGLLMIFAEPGVIIDPDGEYRSIK